MKEYRFTIPGRPVTKKNSLQIISRGGKPIPLPSKAFLQYQKDAGIFIPYKWYLIDNPVNLRVVYWMPTRAKVDLLNLLGATCDILVYYGVLKDDNSSIVQSHDGSRVCYDKQNPRAEIVITEV